MFTFKDQARLDYNTFFNCKEFACSVVIDDKKLIGVVDQDFIVTKSNLQMDYFDGVYKDKLTVYLRYSDLGYLPQSGNVLDIDGERYEVVNSSVAHGVITLNVGVNDG